MNSSSTRPMKKGRPRIPIDPNKKTYDKRGRPKTTGPFSTREEFEAECLEHHNRGWSMPRIALKFGVCKMTIKRALKIIKNNS